MAPSMPGKTARALCPVCQEPMPPDETECENCGAFVIDEAVVRLSRAFGIPREKALALFEKGFRHPKQLSDRDVDDVLQKGENGLLFLCTNCGGFVATGDPKCPRCGAEFEEEEPAPAPPEKDILDLVLCPVCGADNDPVWKECEICGEPLGGTEEPPGAAPELPAELPAVVALPAAEEESLGLDRLDDILKGLEASPTAKGTPKSQRVQKVSKVTKRLPTPRASPPEARPKPRPRPKRVPSTKPVAPIAAAPKPRPAAKPVARPASEVVPLGHPRASRPPPAPTRPRPVKIVSTGQRTRRWGTPPPELTGGLVGAAAVGLIASNLLGEPLVAWGIAGVLGVLILVLAVSAFSTWKKDLHRFDALLVVAGVACGAGAPLLRSTYAPAASAAAALLLALATRRLLATRGRDLLVVASGLGIASFAVVEAAGRAFTDTPAWLFGVLAMVPWPVAVAALGLRARATSAAAHRELVRAERDLARRDYAGSVRDFDRAIALGAKGTPGEELPWYGKGASLILLGRYDEALKAIDTALDLNPRNEVAWLNKGNALTKLGRLSDALRCFNAAIRVNPAYEVAWNNRGNTLARLGHLDEALACYERALQIDPDYRSAWVNKGYVLTKLGRYDEATSCADRVLRLNEAPRTRTA